MKKKEQAGGTDDDVQDWSCSDNQPVRCHPCVLIKPAETPQVGVANPERESTE